MSKVTVIELGIAHSCGGLTINDGMPAIEQTYLELDQAKEIVKKNPEMNWKEFVEMLGLATCALCHREWHYYPRGDKFITEFETPNDRNGTPYVLRNPRQILEHVE